MSRVESNGLRSPCPEVQDVLVVDELRPAVGSVGETVRRRNGEQPKFKFFRGAVRQRGQSLPCGETEISNAERRQVGCVWVVCATAMVMHALWLAASGAIGWLGRSGWDSWGGTVCIGASCVRPDDTGRRRRMWMLVSEYVYVCRRARRKWERAGSVWVEQSRVSSADAEW